MENIYNPYCEEVKKCMIEISKKHHISTEKCLSIYNKYIASVFKKHGIIIIRKTITPDTVKRCIQDIWKYIVDLPFSDGIKKGWENMKKDFEGDFFRDVTKKEALWAKENYPMTGGFGALTRSPIFHLPTLWEMRQNPDIVNVFSNILGTENLMVTLDRVSLKFPGQGETEFCHWDSNPWEWDKEEESLQGILSLSETSFYAAPGTHTLEFRKEFIENYPESKRRDQYYITKDHDPMNLMSKIQEYKLQPGDFVIWSNRTLHEARKNKTNKIRYAYYISYFKWNNPGRYVNEQYSKKKIDFIKDRIRSYETGDNPLMFPSGTPINLYSKQAYMYNPDSITKFSLKFKTGYQEIEYKSGKKKGEKVIVPIYWKNENYKPPVLTTLGKKLLGIER